MIYTTLYASTDPAGSTTMLIEELTDINADVWDADCDELEPELSPQPPQLETDSPPTPSTSDSGTFICNVEVHSDPSLPEGNPDHASPVLSTHLSLTVDTDDDGDVSTQQLDLSPNIASSSYYSAQSSTRTSIPSLSSRNSIHTSDVSTSVPTSPASCVSDVNSGDLVQEIMDVVQSEGFARDTAAAEELLHCGSSQFSLFTSGQESREYQSNTDAELSDSTPVRVDGFGTRNSTASQPVREQISLIVLDRRFDGTIAMREDWGQDQHTML